MVKSDASSKLVDAVERLIAGHTFFSSPAAMATATVPNLRSTS